MMRYQSGGTMQGNAGWEQRRASAYRIEPFTYKDGLGTCGKIAATECEPNVCP